MYFLNKKVFLVLIIPTSLVALYLWPTLLGGDTEFLLVQGNSMLPTILPGSLVITKTSPQYEVDDIVSYIQQEERQKKVIVHRIIEETDKGFVIKGDNNPRKDPGFPTYDDIKGKVIFATPYFGDLVLLLRNPVILVMSSIVMIIIQYEQKRIKTKKEKIRRIRLGLPFNEIQKQKQKKVPKKADYNLFLGAIAFNVLTYILVQISINYNLAPKGDMVTGFLFRMFAPSFASTLAFGMYFIFIFGLYFIAKRKEKKMLKSTQVSARKSKTMQLLVGKNSNLILGISQFLCVLFIIMSLFHIMSFGTDLVQAVTCDPTQEIC